MWNVSTLPDARTDRKSDVALDHIKVHSAPVSEGPTEDERRGYHHGNLRRALLDGALALLKERGSFDFTLRELARTAGVTHNAPYRHFASKPELLGALKQEGFGLLAERARQALARSGDSPRERIRALGEAYVRFALAHPEHFRLMTSEAAERPGGERVAEESFRLLEGAIADGQSRGAVRRDLSARELALAAWAIVHGLASLLASGQVPRGESRVARYSELVAAVFFDGAGARDEASAPAPSTTRPGSPSRVRTQAGRPRRTRRRRRQACCSGPTRRAR
jgi:AcrR family transcriptional regulator